MPLDELMQATRLLSELDLCVKSYEPDLVYDKARLAEVKERVMAKVGASDAEFLTALLVAAARHGPLATMDSLFERYANSTGRPMTPPPVADLMAELAMPECWEVIVFDPATGTGELLAAAFEDRSCDARGQELDSGLATLAGLRLNFLADDEPYSATVMAGDATTGSPTFRRTWRSAIRSSAIGSGERKNSRMTPAGYTGPRRSRSRNWRSRSAGTACHSP